MDPRLPWALAAAQSHIAACVTSRQKYDGEDIIENFREAKDQGGPRPSLRCGVRMHSSSAAGVLAFSRTPGNDALADSLIVT
jgi:hypothetical protein